MTGILDFADAAALAGRPPAVRAALEDLRACGPGGALTFPAGAYHFWPQRAEERYLFQITVAVPQVREVNGQGGGFYPQSLERGTRYGTGRDRPAPAASVPWSPSPHPSTYVLHLAGQVTTSGGVSGGSYRGPTSRTPPGLTSLLSAIRPGLYSAGVPLQVGPVWEVDHLDRVRRQRVARCRDDVQPDLVQPKGGTNATPPAGRSF